MPGGQGSSIFNVIGTEDAEEIKPFEAEEAQREGQPDPWVTEGFISESAAPAAEEFTRQLAQYGLAQPKTDVTAAAESAIDILGKGEIKSEGAIKDALKDIKTWGKGAEQRTVREEGRAKKELAPLDPFIGAGTKALGAWEEAMGLKEGGRDLGTILESLPGYKFRMEQTQKMIERSAAGRGGFFSGRMGAELTRGAQGVASAEFGRYLEQLTGMTEQGRAAATTKSQLATKIRTDYSGMRADLTKAQIAQRGPLGTQLASIYQRAAEGKADITTGRAEFEEMMAVQREGQQIGAKDWLGLAGRLAPSLIGLI